MKKATAFETTKEIIRNRVYMINQYRETVDEWDNTTDRLMHELTGMLVILKNISDDENFYNIQFNGKRVEFGYYDANSKWITIEK